MPNPVDLITLSSDLPVFLQNGIGVGYSAIDVRRALGIGQVQEGVVAAGDGKVTQRAGGAGMAVDVAVFEAFVKGDTVAGEGMYYVRRAAALTGATELTATAADGANPRIDQVILEIKNDIHDGSGLNRGRVRYLAGTATAGATLDNRTGAAALPNTAVRLADVLMPAAAANVPTANIRDRRPWARGLFWRGIRTTNVGPVSVAAFTNLGANELKPRIEASGVPMRVKLEASVAGQFAGFREDFELWQNAGALSQSRKLANVPVNAHEFILDITYTFIPTPGSSVLEWAWRSTTAAASTLTLQAAAPQSAIMVVEELVRQNSDNT